MKPRILELRSQIPKMFPNLRSQNELKSTVKIPSNLCFLEIRENLKTQSKCGFLCDKITEIGCEDEGLLKSENEFNWLQTSHKCRTTTLFTQAVSLGLVFGFLFFFLRSVTNLHLVSTVHASLMHACKRHITEVVVVKSC